MKSIDISFSEKAKEGRIANTEKEKIFAYWYFFTRDLLDAMQKAGIQQIEELSSRRLRSQWKKVKKVFSQESAGELAKLGLYRILFSQVRVDEQGKPILDGFLMQKFSEGKETEYQLRDKLKACELLMKLEETESGKKEEKFSQILQAIQHSAQEAILLEEGERKDEEI